MRFLCLLLAVLLTASCSNPHKLDNVKKYCVLTTMPHASAADLRAIHDRGLKLFKERKPFKRTDVNQRVIAAATAVVTSANVAAIQVEHPELFPGQPQGMGLPLSEQQLIEACTALGATPTHSPTPSPTPSPTVRYSPSPVRS